MGERERLLRLLSASDEATKLSAAIRLEEIGDEAVIEPLIQILNSEYRWLPSKAVAFVLGSIGDKRAVEALTMRLERMRSFSRMTGHPEESIEERDFRNVVEEAIEKIHEREECTEEPIPRRETLRERIGRARIEWGP